jgi:hypothetical protein
MMGEKRRKVEAGTIVDIKTTRTPINMCLSCGYVIDAASNHKGRAPHPGAIAICLKCAHIMIFNNELKLRELTDNEVVEIAGHPEMLQMMKALGRARAEYERVHGKDQWAKRKLDN